MCPGAKAVGNCSLSGYLVATGVLWLLTVIAVALFLCCDNKTANRCSVIVVIVLMFLSGVISLIGEKTLKILLVRF
jgi:hypothetical protein